MPRRFLLYESLLSLYPKPYRKRYAQQMVQTLSDMLDDPDNSKSVVWARACLDLPVSLMKQNVIYVGVTMKNQTPQYVKRNALISTLLIAPFFIVILSRVLQNNDFSNSDVWRSSLYITLVFLPLAAFMLATLTFLKWSHDQKQSVWKNLLDIRRNWLITFVGGLALIIALFVPFHDSTHCITGNPIREVANISQTWQCIQKG
jgi:hypothetical protein